VVGTHQELKSKEPNSVIKGRRKMAEKEKKIGELRGSQG